MRNPIRARKPDRPATLSGRARWLTLACAGMLLLGSASQAADPAWWQARGAITAGATPAPNAVVNQGQLKQFTLRAVQELNASLASVGGAGEPLNSLITGWQQDYASNAYATNPNNPSRPYKPADFDAVTVGQLKYVANLLYGRLHDAGYMPVVPAWIKVNSDTDRSLAALGQLKSVFNFDLGLDPSGSGLPIAWEIQYFGHTDVDPEADEDGDTLTNLQEYIANLDPRNPDTDEDGLNDSVDPQPTRPNPMAPTPLSIGVPSLEAQQGTVDYAQVDYGSVEVRWQTSAGGAAPTKFRVDRSLDGIAWATLKTIDAPASSISETGLLANQRYHYRVVAIAGNGLAATESPGAVIKYAPPVRFTVIGRASSTLYDVGKGHWAFRQFTDATQPEYYLTRTITDRFYRSDVSNNEGIKTLVYSASPAFYYKYLSEDSTVTYGSGSDAETQVISSHRYNFAWGAGNKNESEQEDTTRTKSDSVGHSGSWGADYYARRSIVSSSDSAAVWMGNTWIGGAVTYSGSSHSSNGFASVLGANGTWLPPTEHGAPTAYATSPVWMNDGIGSWNRWPDDWFTTREPQKMVYVYGDGRGSLTIQLSNPYTTTAFFQDAVANLPDYPFQESTVCAANSTYLNWSYVNGESHRDDTIVFYATPLYQHAPMDLLAFNGETRLGYPIAYANFWPRNEALSLQKIKYHYEWAPSANAIVRGYEVFVSNKDRDAETKLLRAFDIQLGAGSNRSAEFERVPDPEHPEASGSYCLLFPSIVVMDTGTTGLLIDSPISLGTELVILTGGLDWPSRTRYTWSADGPVHITGPVGEDVFAWRLSADGGNDPAGNKMLIWPPGSYTVKCVFSFPGGGGDITVERKLNVKSMPVETGSEDRMFYGSIRLPNGLTDVGLKIVNETSGQDLGVYPNIFAATPSSKVYGSFEEIFSKQEVEGAIDTNQRIVFVREASDPGKLIFFGISDRVGKIRISLVRGAEEISSASITLTTKAAVSDLIDQIDARISSLSLPALEEGPPPRAEGSGAPPLPREAHQGAAAPAGPKPIANPNLTTKAAIPFFKQGPGYQVGPFFSRNRVEAAFTKGFIDGVWGGGQQDLESLGDFRQLLNDPKKRAAEIYNSLLVIAPMPVDELALMLSHTYYGFLSEAERELQWDFKGEAPVKRWEVNSYAMGYALAYGSEQFVVGAAAGAAVKVSGNTMKGVLTLSKAGNLAAGAIKVGRRFKARYVRFAAEQVTASDLLGHVARGAERLGGMEINGKLGTQIFENALDARNATLINLSKITAEMNQALKELPPDLNFHGLGKAYWFLERQATFVSGMGGALSEKGWLGYIRAYRRLINEGAPGGAADRLDDLAALFGASGQNGKAALNESLEAFKDATEAAGAGPQPRFKFKKVESVHQRGYRYSSFDPRWDKNGNPVTGQPTLRAADAESYGWYATFDKYEGSTQAISKTQLPTGSTAKYRLEFDTQSVKDSIYVPYAQLEKAPYFQPVARDFLDYGEGGASQVLIKEKDISIKEIWNISVNPPQKLYP